MVLALGIPEIISTLAEIDAALLLQVQQSQAQADVLNNLKARTDNIYTYVQGLGILLTSLQAQVSALQATLQGQIGQPQQATEPVILPTNPPPAYGGPSVNDVSSGVWAAHSADENQTYGQILAIQAAFQRLWTDNTGWQGRFSPGFAFNFSGLGYINNPFTSFEQLSVNSILPTDATRLDWLGRVAPGYTWQDLGDGTLWAAIGGEAEITCLITEGQFQFLRMLAGGATMAAFATSVPPVWPGLANATIGTPIALALGVTITQPMDGVIIEITGVPPDTGSFTFDDVISWRNVGALAFFSDNGDEELPQTLGFQSAVYAPRTMKRAAGVKVRTSKSIVGTITPWTVN